MKNEEGGAGSAGAVGAGAAGAAAAAAAPVLAVFDWLREDRAPGVCYVGGAESPSYLAPCNRAESAGQPEDVKGVGLPWSGAHSRGVGVIFIPFGKGLIRGYHKKTSFATNHGGNHGGGARRPCR